ncbi:DgyrCDS8404 [Dimorphilus gyrociliatus]|uniref:DgyrCDS8404 n=1 Tax=Dimorphilus gyrociliatus TaxID=2664684 RepID=A0A7I8VUA2_9ANNE|nr:DgyrCDS8404 [Dimorphilus gyrociliatus]
MGLFGKDKPSQPTKEKVREWTAKVRQEGRQLERQIRGIEREKQKVELAIKSAAKKKDIDSIKILAREIVQSKKAISKIYAAKAHLTTIENGMNAQLATIRTAGCIQRSTEVMSSMQRLVKVPEIQNTMRELSKEMTRAGIIEEMIEDTFEDIDQEDMEDEVEKEVEAVVNEIIGEPLKRAPTAVNDSLPVVEEPQEEDAEDMSEMQARLQALRS